MDILPADFGELLQQFLLFPVEIGWCFHPDNNQLITSPVSLQRGDPLALQAIDLS